MKRWLQTACLVLAAWGPCVAAGQAGSPEPDSDSVFALADLEVLMFRYHPVLRQADLLGRQARAQVQQARGRFDPALRAGFDRKEFGETLYYNKWTSELKVPVWLGGADLKVGYDRAIGDYLNPEYYTGNTGLTAVGISIPLGQGLLIDERRRTLRQAQVMVRFAEADRTRQIITAWYGAVQDYWNWYYAWEQYRLVEEGVLLAETRFTAIRNQSLLGDKPAIDTVEAFITLQDRRQQLAKVGVDLQNTRLVLSNHLWNEAGQPLELPESARPQPAEDVTAVTDAALDSLVQTAASRHPELIRIQSRQRELEIERRYRRELLRPKLNLSGSLLSRRTDFGSYVPEYYDFGIRNYKVGVDFALPLLLRAERGRLAEAGLRLESAGLDLQNADRRIRIDIYTSYNALRAFRQQLDLQVGNIRNQQALLSAEQQKFELGESTLFLINSRESRLIDMRLKRAELTTGYQKKLAELYYRAGTRQQDL